jgi:hypothetical protein
MTLQSSLQTFIPEINQALYIVSRAGSVNRLQESFESGESRLLIIMLIWIQFLGPQCIDGGAPTSCKSLLAQ